MDTKIIKFDDIEIKKYKFHQNKSSILINDIDINRIIGSNQLPFRNKILNISLTI